MLSTQSNTTRIGRLRIRSNAPDPQAEKQRVDQMLRSAMVHPAGLPQSATLIVRRLADPLPSRLRVNPFNVQVDPEWERAVSSALEKYAASAVRPAFGAVPAEAGAVLFHDHAEVLSSLATDWMSGSLSLHWWWREVLRGRDAATALLSEWIEAPHYLPGALDLLAKESRAVPFVQRLPEPAVAEMLRAVLTAHAVPRLALDDAAPLPSYSENRSDLNNSNSSNDSNVQTGPMANAKPDSRRSVLPRRHIVLLPPVWLPWVPEASTPGLLPIQKLLLIQTLMLRRAPGTARTLSFQRELLQWQAGAQKEAEKEVREAGESDVELEREARPHRLLETTEDLVQELAAEAAAPSPNGLMLKHGESKTIAEGSSEASHLTAMPAEQASADVLNESTGAEASDLQHNDLQDYDGQELVFTPEPKSKSNPNPNPNSVAKAPREEEQRAQETPCSLSIETEFGGVLFLLSLALYLDIYGDFTTPAATGLELNIWDFLALMAAELIKVEGVDRGIVDRAVVDRTTSDDPLWDELARLAGRSTAQRPGSSFDPPEEWRISSEWLRPFQDSYVEQPVFRNGRTLSLHPAGFTVFDLPAELDDRDEEPTEPVDALQRWVGWMAGYLRARLVLALGRDDAATLLCRRRARIALTLTHIDATFSLDHHPIEVRMAGLDRNLGWIPAAGHYVTFHFE